MGWRKRNSDDVKRCSFCHKAEAVAGKLISGPSDYPAAYICDECIAVCNSILEDSRSESKPGKEEPDAAGQLAHMLLDQLTPEQLDAVRHLLEVMLIPRR
ncbi:MAG: hypothetical protein JO099_01580 [Acidobacteriia bacterium]|nr:hypothetical protein [Terriglobia bacterium]